MESVENSDSFPMEHFIGTPRPDTGTPDTFPSGHTAQAFAAATWQ